MAWWQIWRSASTEQHRTDPPDVSAGFPTHTYPPETGNDASETGGDASETGGGPSGTGGVTEREPQGWRLTPPLTLSSDRAMPVTANPALQRMLASHIPVPQLAATARPMGHDRRIDGPIGTVSSVMRTVSSSPDALMASTHVVGGDLVLRRKPLASADESTLPVGPVRRTASGVGAQAGATPTAVSGGSPAVDRSSFGPAEVSDFPSGQAGLVGKGSAPSDSAIELRSLPAAAPLVSDSGVAASLVRVSRSAVPSLSASPSSPGMSASGMPLVPGTTEALSGPQAGTVQDLSVVARQRRVIEVRSGAEPISLSAFATTGAGAQRQPNALSPAPSPEPGIERFADPVPSGTSGSAPSVTGPVSNPDEADLSALQASADSSTLTPVAPTVGLRRGLGSPMSSLPPSAVSRLADPDPFAGWNDVPAPELPVAGRDLTATGPTAAPGSPGSPGSPTGGSRHTGFIDAAGSGLVSRSPDSVPSASGSGASAQVSDGGSPAEESDTAAPVVAAGIDPREAGPGAHSDDPYVGLQHVSNGGPLIGQRRFDVVLQETLMPLSVSPHEVASAPVNLQWGSNTDDRAAAPRTTGPGSSVASVASVQRTADHTGSSSGSPRGAASVLRGSVPGRPAAASFGSSAGSASVSWPGTPSSAAVLRSLSTASAGGAPNRGPSTFVGFAGGERAGGPVPPTVAGVVDPAAPWEDEPVSRWLPVVGGSGSDQVRRVPETSAVPPAVRPSPSANPVRNVVEVWREADEGPTPPAGQDLPPGSGPPADGAPPAGNGAGDPGSGQSAPAAPPTGAGGAGAGAAGGGSDADLDQLAGRLYERIRQRLRRELLDDRERAGFSLDRVR